MHTSLPCNRIEDEDVKAVAEALKRNTTLTMLVCDDEIKCDGGCDGVEQVWRTRLRSIVNAAKRQAGTPP